MFNMLLRTHSAHLLVVGLLAQLSYSHPSSPAVTGSIKAGSANEFVPGAVVTACTVPGTIALTFNDGPWEQTTSKILDLLDAAGMHATFFVNGENWSRIWEDPYPELLKRAMAEGHQLGSLTWSHKNLVRLPDQKIGFQLRAFEDTFRKIIGKVPRIVRLPFLDSNERVVRRVKERGYTVIGTDLNVYDWVNLTPAQQAANIDIWARGLEAGRRLVSAHDIYHWTADVLVPRMISDIQKRGLKAVTVGECLGVPASGWYQE